MTVTLRQTGTGLGPPRVLIVGEDFKGGAAENVWYKPTIAPTLEAASVALQAHHFDVVLIPISASHNDGLALPSMLLDMQKQGGLSRLPQVLWCSAISAFVLAPHVRLARSSGVAVHVVPPLSINTAQHVSRVLTTETPLPHQSSFTNSPGVSDHDLLCALLSGSDFRIVLQPQVDLQSGRYVGAEALSRWRHPELGEVSPSIFVPMANKAGLNLLMFSLVEAKVIALLRALKHRGINLPISVNASADTLRTAGLADRLAQRLASAGVETSMFKIELEEDFHVGDLLSLSTALWGMRLCGFPIALDDFGCGGATLDLLTKLPFSELKIAGRFVRRMRSEPGCKAAVSSAISIARDMNIDFIAEGIETPEQVEDLLSEGCRYGQGFALSAPLEVNKFLQTAVLNVLGTISA